MSSLGEKIKTAFICAGTVFRGPYEDVDHEKYYVLAIRSKDGNNFCTVLINSSINQFIYKRQELLERQVPIKSADYNFLSHNSFVNCAKPIVVEASRFKYNDFSVLGTIDQDLLDIIIENIKLSNRLTAEEYNMFF